jgi:hypothetical protein
MLIVCMCNSVLAVHPALMDNSAIECKAQIDKSAGLYK